MEAIFSQLDSLAAKSEERNGMRRNIRRLRNQLQCWDKSSEIRVPLYSDSGDDRSVNQNFK